MKINIKVSPTSKPGQWVVLESFMFSGIKVEAGQLTDGASIPWWLRGVLKTGGKLFAPSVIHDTIYRHGIVSRRRADNVYRNAMRANYVPKWKIKVIYLAVRLFGGSSYKG